MLQEKHPRLWKTLNAWSRVCLSAEKNLYAYHLITSAACILTLSLLRSELNNSLGGENYRQIRQQYTASQYGVYQYGISSNKNSGINTLLHI